jgi:hypothetical protein
MIDEIERRLIEGSARGVFQGLLFHGSGEPWDGDPRPGGDGIFWTADSPVIAQQYIPASGGSVFVSMPFEHRLSEMAPPDRHSFWNMAARQMTGLQCLDVEYDESGMPRSWRYPQGWPTLAECVAWLRDDLGYDLHDPNTPTAVKCSFEDGKETLMSADWYIQGTLLVTLSDGLEWRDLRSGEEGDLMDLEYHRYGDFAQAERDGVDGVIINDFAQTDEGNLGHVSYGLTSHGLANRDWLEIPAIRHPYTVGRTDDLTEAIREWTNSDRPRLANRNPEFSRR